MSPSHLALLLAVMLLWGGNFVAVKVGLEQFPPFLQLALRFGLAAVMLAPFLRWPRGRFLQVAALSLTLGVVHFSLLFLGMRNIDAATAAIAIQLQVPFAALLAALLFNDRPGWRRITGMALAFAGVALIAGEPRLQGGLGSLMLVVGAAAAFAVTSVQMKGLGPGVGVLTMYGWLSLLATPPLLLLSFFLEQDQVASIQEADWRGWSAVVYQAALATVMGHGSWYFFMRRYPINLVMPFTLLVPIFGVLSGVILLGEELTMPIVIGGMATLAGVGIIVVRRPRAVGPAAGGGTI